SSTTPHPNLRKKSCAPPRPRVQVCAFTRIWKNSKPLSRMARTCDGFSASCNLFLKPPTRRQQRIEYSTWPHAVSHSEAGITRGDEKHQSLIGISGSLGLKLERVAVRWI